MSGGGGTPFGNLNVKYVCVWIAESLVTGMGWLKVDYEGIQEDWRYISTDS